MNIENYGKIQEMLIKKGKDAFEKNNPKLETFSSPEADVLINDIEKTPHAFVIACVMDRQIKAEKAWNVPLKLSQRLGTFRFEDLRTLKVEDVLHAMTLPTPIHRFLKEMSRNFCEAVKRIDEKYSGDASKIWADEPTSAEVVYRFLQFRGVGPKIGTMAANILARHFKVPFADYFSIDISVDVHVKRVFARLGLTDKDDSNEGVIYRARSLNPGFPGLLDFPTWEIGKNWCHETKPECGNCYMKDLCRSRNANS